MRSAAVVVLMALAASVANAAEAKIKCGPGIKCPESAPCCSPYNFCGRGAYCLGGCNPLFSHSIQSCVPSPVCKSQDYKFDSLNGVTSQDKYLGDSTKANWVSTGQPVVFDNSVLLTMPVDSVGTLLASTTYMWYGKVSATLKTSRGAGVVTAFILMSDVRDEIDFEFVGTDLTTAQTNYYFQGITNYQNGANISLSDTFNNYHTYTIEWTPEQITWSIDGQVGRTKKRSDTYNKTTNRYEYPQTPSRVQLSLWPGGLPTNAEGTIKWAGGLVDWNSQDIKTNGYYYAAVKDVSIQCYDPPSNAKRSGSKAFVYTNIAGTEDTIEITDKPTVLKSFLGSGTNMSADYPSSSASSSSTRATSTRGSSTSSAASSSASADATEIPTIPGMSGYGPGTDGQRGGGGGSGSAQSGGDSSSNTNANSSGASGGGASASQSATPSSTGGFSQGATQNSGAAPGASGLQAIHGSIFAMVVTLFGLLLL